MIPTTPDDDPAPAAPPAWDAAAWARLNGDDHTHDGFLLAPADPRDARIAALEAEVARLRAAIESAADLMGGDRTAFGAAGMTLLNALAAPSPSAARGAALLRCVALLERVAAADSLAQMMDMQDEADAALYAWRAARGEAPNADR